MCGSSDRAVPTGSNNDIPKKSMSNGGSSWGISSIFGGSDVAVKGNSTSKPLSEQSFSEKFQSLDHAFSTIHLREPPSILRPSETHSDQETIEITIIKLLLRSYYDIVRKTIEDSVPKAIMHFLVNHSKRELHNVFIKKLYRDDVIEEMLREPDEIALKRKRTKEMLRVLQQAFRTLDELPLEAESIERGGYGVSTDQTGLPKIRGLPSSSLYTSSGSPEYSYSPSPKTHRSRKSPNSGELQSPLFPNGDSNGSGRTYPTGVV